MESEENSTKVSYLNQFTFSVFTFRFVSHLDCVRAIAFHSQEMLLASGGDDCTVKLWRIDASSLSSSK